MVIRANKKLNLIVFLPLLLSLNVNSQITGLWETTSVMVGQESMTPLAKWTEFNADGSYTSGNGWLTNSDGTWDFDATSNSLSVVVKTGFANEFGPFSVEMLSDSTMKWTRTENGEEVIVYNQRVADIPKHPATLAVGLWMVKEVQNEGVVITESFTSEEFQAVFVRWDNLFQEITSEGRKSGIWRVNAHRPVIDVLYYDGNKPLQYWEMDFEGETGMTWKRDDLMIIFERLDAFPE